MTVTKLRVSGARLLKGIREAAKSSANLVFIPPPSKKSIAGMMTFLQTLACIREGAFSGTPRLNENGDWEFVMKRHAAGVVFMVKGVAVCDGARVGQVVILNAESNHVSL